MLLESIRRRLVGKEPAPASEPDDLPPDLAARIAGATVAERGADEHGNPRILVLFGSGAIDYSRVAALGWLGRGWPRLTKAQTDRALAMLHDHVVTYMRQAAHDTVVRAGFQAPGRRWADWRPLQFPEVSQ